MMLGKIVYGNFGELHPKITKDYDISGKPVACEIFLDNIPLPKIKKSTALSKAELYNLQSVTRDFAFVLYKYTSAEILLRAVRKAEKKLITNIDIFDVFSGGTLEENQKSIAIRVTFQPNDKSLTDMELAAIMNNIINEAHLVGAVLR